MDTRFQDRPHLRRHNEHKTTNYSPEGFRLERGYGTVTVNKRKFLLNRIFREQREDNHKDGLGA